MKKLSFLLIVICLLLASCDQTLPTTEPEEEQHVHTWDDGYYTVVPTCQTDGERVYTCTTCNETKTEVIPADGTSHAFSSEWSHDETQHWHAATCEHEVTPVKENHDWGETEVIKEGSCTEDGEERTTCKVCGYSVTEIIPKETLHDYDTGNNTCKSCGDVCYFQAQYTQNKVFVTLRATYYNSGLTDLVIPEYVPNYNYSRWYRTEVIKSVPASTLEFLVISEGATTIGYQAFKGHANLKTVVLPSTLITIEQEAFMDCTALESLTIPASVTFIGDQALAYCTSLTDIYYDGTSDEWLALLSTGKLILYNSSSATVHYSKY